MASSDSFENRLYTQEEVQQILNLAIAQHAYTGEFSRAQLLEIADDLAIPPAIVHQAEQAWRQSNLEQTQRETFNQQRRSDLRRRVGTFCIVNAGLILLNALMGFGFPWSLYILVFWGLALGLKSWNVFHQEGEAYETAFQRWHRKHLLRTAINRWLGRVISKVG